MKTHRNIQITFNYSILTLAAGAFFGTMFVTTANPIPSKDGWTELFNGKDLEGWHASIGKGGDEKSQKAEEIFTVHDGVIHVYRGAEDGSKQFNANLYHESTWGSFRLQVEYRWLEKKFEPRAKDDRDAGILIHIHDKLEEVWPSSIEMQLADGKLGSRYVAGDLFVLGNSRVESSSPNGDFDPKGAMVTRGVGKLPGRAKVTIHADKSHGEWNTAELVVHGSKMAEYYLNGTLVNVIHDMKFKDENGEWKPLEKGHISVQGEWAELEYRAIRIKQIGENE